MHKRKRLGKNYKSALDYGARIPPEEPGLEHEEGQEEEEKEEEEEQQQHQQTTTTTTKAIAPCILTTLASTMKIHGFYDNNATG